MYRVVKMPSQIYAMEIELEEDIENIKAFVDSSEVVILCNDLADLEDIDIHKDEIEIVIADDIP